MKSVLQGDLTARPIRGTEGALVELLENQVQRTNTFFSTYSLVFVGYIEPVIKVVCKSC